MKAYAVLKKGKTADREAPFTVSKMEELVLHISYAARFLGLSLAAFAAVSSYNLLIIPTSGTPDYRVIHMGEAILYPLLLAGVSCAVVFVLTYRKLRPLIKGTVTAYPRAAERYLEYSSKKQGGVKCPAALFGGGMVFNVCAMFFCRYENFNVLLFIGALGSGLGAFFLFSRLFKRWVVRKLVVCPVCEEEPEDQLDRSTGQKKMVIKWLLYWIAVCAGYLVLSISFGNYVIYVPVLAIALLNCVLRLFIGHPFGRFPNVRARHVAVHFMNLCSTVLVVLLCLFLIEEGSGYNNKYIDSLDYTGFTHHSSISYDRETGVYTVAAEQDELRILQLTDIHICGSITTISTDRKAFTACYELIKEARPDLIIVTGDIVFPIPQQTFSRNNLIPIYQFCAFMNNIGIPWAMVYGNHDTEAVASNNARQLTGIYLYFLEEKDCPMLYADVQPEVYGRYNQYLRLENADGSLNYLLFLVDSNDYVKGVYKTNEYDSVHPDQMRWYADTIDAVSAEEGRVVPSFVFMHIPFPAFREAQEALHAGSEDAVYLFGENKEGVSCPDREFGFFDLIVEKKSTKAVFVGHDHVNNMAVNYRGVDLVYGKSIDYIAYPGIAKKSEQRGALLIALKKDGSYTMQQIDYRE